MQNITILTGRLLPEFEQEIVEVPGKNSELQVRFTLLIPRELAYCPPGKMVAEYVSCVARLDAAKFILENVNKDCYIFIQGRLEFGYFDYNSQSDINRTQIRVSHAERVPLYEEPKLPKVDEPEVPSDDEPVEVEELPF